MGVGRGVGVDVGAGVAVGANVAVGAEASGVLLTGGNNLDTGLAHDDLAPERDAAESALLAWAIERSKPISGDSLRAMIERVRSNVIEVSSRGGGSSSPRRSPKPRSLWMASRSWSIAACHVGPNSIARRGPRIS